MSFIRKRRESGVVHLGSVPVGGTHPITVQTMTKTDTRDVCATVEQLKRIADAGCDIVRIAVPDQAAADALRQIVPQSTMPVVADIHFDHTLALRAIENGVHGLRLNPGNIRSDWKVKEIVSALRERMIPVRVGVNAGSLDPEVKSRFGGITPEAPAYSALNEVARLEKFGYDRIEITIKAFDLPLMIAAVKRAAESCGYPIHLGVTESGLPEQGIVRSSMGIGALLLEGIGDTIRVSLTGDPVLEVATGIEILKSAGLRKAGPIIVSCPTCGRCGIPLEEFARKVRQATKNIDYPLQIAVMGCAVNGPGEASQADFGIAGGKDSGLIFRKGEIIRSLPSDKLVEGLLEEISSFLKVDCKI